MWKILFGCARWSSFFSRLRLKQLLRALQHLQSSPAGHGSGRKEKMNVHPYYTGEWEWLFGKFFSCIMLHIFFWMIEKQYVASSNFLSGLTTQFYYNKNNISACTGMVRVVFNQYFFQKTFIACLFESIYFFWLYFLCRDSKLEASEYLFKVS